MGDLSSGGVLKTSRERSSQLFLGRLHSCIACLRFASRLHFGASGCNCKHVPHRKGDWQGLRFAPSALRFGTASSNDTREERKKLQQVSGILVVANRKIA
jgi:hypothetical protein